MFESIRGGAARVGQAAQLLLDRRHRGTRPPRRDDLLQEVRTVDEGLETGGGEHEAAVAHQPETGFHLVRQTFRFPEFDHRGDTLQRMEAAEQRLHHRYRRIVTVDRRFEHQQAAADRGEVILGLGEVIVHE